MKWKTELILIGLVLLLINANTDNGRLICPKSRVGPAVGESVTLECHVDPERDVTPELFKLMFNQADPVLVYGDGKVSDDQAEQFKGRVSLESNSENLSKGEFVVKISPLNTTDAGTYTCTAGKGSHQIFCSIELIIDPKENRIPGNPTDNGGGDHNTYVTGSGSVIGIVIIIVIIIVIVVAVVLCRRRTSQRQENNQNVAPEEIGLNAPLNAPDERNG